MAVDGRGGHDQGHAALTAVPHLGPLAHSAAPVGAAPWLELGVVTVAPGLLYLAGVRLLRKNSRTWSPWRTGSFLGGVVLVGLALSPVVEGASVDARGHMVQHLLLGMYAPIALMLGAPVTLLLAAVPVPARRPISTVMRSRVVHAVSHVGTAAALNIGGLYLLYLTPLYALATGSGTVHHLLHAHFLVAGYLFAWAVAGPDPSPRRPGMGIRIGVVIGAGGAHGFLAKLLYSRAPTWPPDSSHTIVELQQAAQWMYYGGHLSELLLLTALFAAWYRRTRRGVARPQGQRVPHDRVLPSWRQQRAEWERVPTVGRRENRVAT